MIKERYFVFKSAEGNTDISAKCWYDDTAQPKAVLQISHGMTEYIERYDPFAQFLAGNGFIVYGHDHLGHGESVQSEEDWGYIGGDEPDQILVSDMHSLRQIASKENPGLPYFMLGHSMGSYLLREYLAFHGEGLAGAIVMGTGFISPFIAGIGLMTVKSQAKKYGWRYRSEKVRNMTFDKYYKKYDLTGQDISNNWLSRDTEIVKAYYEDNKCTYIFTLAGYKALFSAVKFTSTQANVARIPKDLKILLISGDKDPVGAFGEGVLKTEKAFKKAGIQSVDVKLYPGARHEVVRETNKEEAYQDICDWLKAAL